MPGVTAVASEPPPKVKAVHDVVTALRNDGYTVGFDSDDVVEDFDEHVAQGQQQLDADDLAAYFVVAHREGQTDYGTSVVLGDDVVWGLIQVEMLGAHFRAVLDALPLSTTDLIDAMIDEAIAVDDMEGEDAE